MKVEYGRKETLPSKEYFSKFRLMFFPLLEEVKDVVFFCGYLDAISQKNRK